MFASSLVVSFVVPVARAQSNDAPLIARVGAYVEQYYQRAQTLVTTETVTIQPLSRRLEDEGPARRVVNELRIEWDGGSGSQPRELRQVISATGPRFGPAGRPDCLDPRSYSFEPLAFLLPANLHKLRLKVARVETIGSTRTQRIDYEPRRADPPRVDWERGCGEIISPGRTRGHVWVEPATGAVLRFDEQLVGKLDLPGPVETSRRFRAERMDMMIEYKRFTFMDPEETLLLPARVEAITVIRDSDLPRMRVTHTFTDYRRFLTSGRVLH